MKNLKVVKAEKSSAPETAASDAFKVVYYEYFEAISRFIWMKVNSVELARDMAQEVFLRLWSSWDQVDPKQSIKAYLYRIAHNLIIDHFRKQQSRKKYRESLWNYKPIISHESIEQRTAIKIAVDKLPDLQKSVFIMGRYQGLKYAEIAEIFGMSYKKVFQIMQDATEFLKKELQ